MAKESYNDARDRFLLSSNLKNIVFFCSKAKRIQFSAFQDDSRAIIWIRNKIETSYIENQVSEQKSRQEN